MRCAGSREQAFVQSLSTAVLVQAVSKACSTGLSSHCSCGRMPLEAPQDLNHRDNDPQQTVEHFQWGGCPDNLQHGLEFSRAFQRTRAPPSANKRRKVSRRSLINQHNSDVGRQVGLIAPCSHNMVNMHKVLLSHEVLTEVIRYIAKSLIIAFPWRIIANCKSWLKGLTPKSVFPWGQELQSNTIGLCHCHWTPLVYLLNDI